MNPFIESLNRWGSHATTIAGPMLWQSSLLIAALFVLDALLRRRARAVIRYALWSLVLLKLILPPALALPTGLGYWLRPSHPPAVVSPLPPAVSVITFAQATPVPPAAPAVVRIRTRLNLDGGLLLAGLVGSLILFGFLVRRSAQVGGLVRRAGPAPKEFQTLLDDCRVQLGLRQTVRLKLSPSAFSPAVCGLRTPVVLLPRQLAERLAHDQLVPVLLHELIHVQRRDVWVNCLQALLQTVYWWHPLVWLANARIRRVREEAVDEAVMVALGPQAESYPATLLEVAKLAFTRPWIALGLVGIFESKGALQERIRRLVERPVPHSAKLNVAGIVAVAACGALLLPMAHGHRAEAPAAPLPLATASMRGPSVLLNCVILEVSDDASPLLQLGPPSSVGTNGHQVWVRPSEQFAGLFAALSNQPGILIVARPRLVVASGVTGTISVTRATNLNGRTVQLGPVCELTPHVQGTDIDLTLKASLTEMAKVEGDGRTFAANAVGYVTRDAANVRVTVPDSGGGVVHNPGVTTSEGRQLLFVVRPVIVREAGAAAGADRPTPESAAVSAEGNRPSVVQVTASDPPYSLEGDPMTLEELGEALAREVAAGRSRVIQIRAANDVALGSLQKVLDAAQAAGVTRLSLRGTPDDERPSDPNTGSPAVPGLETRIFKVNPSTFIEGMLLASPLDNFAPDTSPYGGGGVGLLDLPRKSVPSRDDRGFVGGGGSGVTSTNRNQALQDAVRAFFTAAGVNMLPPNQLYFKDRTGVLMVRATPQELVMIQKAIEVLNVAPPQLTIEAKFIEAPEDFVKRISVGTEVTSANATNQMRILSDSQARSFLKNLQRTPGVDVLAAPKLTTLSGRQAQIQVVEIKTILTGIDPQALAEPGRTASDVTNASPFLSKQVPLGSTLDVTASAADDGYTVELDATASVTEFLGYDKPTNAVTVYVKGEKKEVEPPLPRMRTRSVSGRAPLYDGQSLLLIGPSTAVTYRFVDKVPVLGDIPVLGRLFRHEGTSQTGKHVLILITPTLIDPAGNRIHTPDSLPFDPNTVPPQPK
jgi:beta-lactamase regulating signal transducer with metallopeptidase domain/type II secretory pathway component GspD/PulD (secretin)